MKTHITVYVLITFMLSYPISAGEWKYVEDKRVVSVANNTNWYAFFQYMPFDALPLTQKERKKEIASRRVKLSRDAAKNPRGVIWMSEDLTLVISFFITRKIKGGHEFQFTRRDGKDMREKIFTVQMFGQGCWYYEHPLVTKKQ